MAVVLLHHYDGWNAELSAALETRYIPRAWMAEIAAYVFGQLGAQRVYARVPPGSHAERILQGLGFTREGVERNSSASGDRAQYSLLRAEFLTTWAPNLRKFLQRRTP